jgi:ankyrin repeat protein
MRFFLANWRGEKTPKWKNENEEIRYKWINRADPKKPDNKVIFTEIIKNDLSYKMRLEAYKKLDILESEEALIDIANNDLSSDTKNNAILKWIGIADPNKPKNLFIFNEIINNNPSYKIRLEAYKKLDSQESEAALIDIANNDSNINSRINAIMSIKNQDVVVDLLKKKYLSEYRVIVEKLEDQKLLKDLAINAIDLYVRIAAIKKLNDSDLLLNIAKNGKDSDERKIALTTISDQNILVEIVKNDLNTDVRQEAAKKITDQDLIAEICSNSDNKVRRIAAENLIDETNLIMLAEKDEDIFVRLNAVKKVTKQDVLARIVKNDTSPLVREAAVNMVIDQKLLNDIAQNDSDSKVRNAAIRKITNKDFLAKFVKNYDIVTAAQNGITGIVELLLESNKYDLNYAHDNGDTALMLACENGYYETVVFLLNKKANVNKKRKDGVTALMFAAQNGHVEIVRKLIKHGADLNAQYFTGETPLIFATTKGKVDVVIELIEAGCDIKITSTQKNVVGQYTALTWACAKMNKKIVSILKKAGAQHARSTVLGCVECGAVWDMSSMQTSISYRNLAWGTCPKCSCKGAIS